MNEVNTKTEGGIFSKPWRAVLQPDSTYRISTALMDGHDQGVVQVVYRPDVAALVAAAPALLASTRSLLIHLESVLDLSDPAVFELLEPAREAIGRAEGRLP